MEESREEGGVDDYGISVMSGSDLNAHDSSDAKEFHDHEDDEILDADEETDPLLGSENEAKDEKEADEGKIFGISKSLIPFYGLYKLVTKAGPYPLLVLLLLLLAYLHNQLVRYTLPITAAEVAGDLHYGNKSCTLNRDALDNLTSFYPNNVSGHDIDHWTDHCTSSELE